MAQRETRLDHIQTKEQSAANYVAFIGLIEMHVSVSGSSTYCQSAIRAGSVVAVRSSIVRNKGPTAPCAYKMIAACPLGRSKPLPSIFSHTSSIQL